jgi:archaellum component FlaC
MAQQDNQIDSSGVLSDISVRLRDIEEKQNLIKDRVLLIGENLISEKEGTNKEVAELKSKSFQLENDIKKLKMAIERLAEDSNNFVRKNEFQILQRQFEMFQPLELARISDVRAIVKEELKRQK